MAQAPQISMHKQEFSFSIPAFYLGLLRFHGFKSLSSAHRHLSKQRFLKVTSESLRYLFKILLVVFVLVALGFELKLQGQALNYCKDWGEKDADFNEIIRQQTFTKRLITILNSSIHSAHRNQI